MKYHSTLGKRAYMRALGLAGAGRDLDDIIASPQAQWRRPWWVRYVKQPTIEVDWDQMQRFDVKGTYFESKEERSQRQDRTKQWILENRPGYTLRDQALNLAVRRGAVDSSFMGHCHESVAVRGFGGGEILGPDALGVPQWEGTPEENAGMIRAVGRYFGASQVGFLELDERIRKLIYTIDDPLVPGGKKLVFEDVDQAYETEDKRAIPNKARWVIVFSVRMSGDVLSRRKGLTPTPLSASATYLAYSRSRFIVDELQAFLYMLGYQGIMGTTWNALGISPALAVMAGLGEMSRLNRMISPEYGPMQRIFKLVTDLPLAPTKPIDAGIMRFCRTCKKCAETCPSGALNMETEPSWEVKGPWNNPGKRAYYEDSPKCYAYWFKSTAACSTCFSVCPFTKKDKSFMHEFVNATISATPMLNGFFARMDDLFGYGKAKDIEEWWGPEELK